MEGWNSFTDDVQRYYGVDMSCLTQTFMEEQTSYYLRTSAWADVHPSQMLSSATRFKSYDLATLTLEELVRPLEVRQEPRWPDRTGLVGCHSILKAYTGKSGQGRTELVL